MTAKLGRLWHEWVGTVPWPFPAALILGHLTIVTVYVTGTAVSTVPFRSASVRTLITSPVMPTAHLICAGLIVAGLLWRGVWQDVAGSASTACWVGYSVLLFVSARTRIPPLGLAGAGMAACIAAMAFLVAVGWRENSVEKG